MDTITKDKFVNLLRDKFISFFIVGDLLKIFGLSLNTNSALLGRLKKNGIVQALVKGKYLFLLTKNPPEDFGIANFFLPNR